MARERSAVPLEEPDGFMLGEPRTQSEHEVPDTLRGLAGGPLEVRELVHLARDTQTVAGVDEQARRVLDRAARSCDTPQLVDEERRRVALLVAAVGLPADDPDTRARCDPLVLQDLGKRSGSVARLVRQAEVLKEVPPEWQRGRAGHRVALVANDQCRVAAWSDDEDRLLESRIESGEVREVRAVLAVRVDDQPVV